METLPATQDDSSGANPSSIKSGDSSPGQNSGRSSPPPNCAICLGTCKNKSFTDSCLHQFCFKCLLTWSKVKAVCPLCKQNFRSIIHNVRSNDQYEEYMVEQRQTEESVERLLDIDTLTIPTRRFRYRTTFTLPRRETIAIQQLLLHYPLVAEAFPRSPPRRRRSPASFRRTVYRHNLWARPLPDFTGRFRDCSPEFYRYNETQMHRLVPWLDRELHYLLNENLGHISYVLNRILELLRQYHMNSFEFRDEMRRYLGDRTEHFLHEMYCFASTPYDMTGYDRNVQYTTDTRISTMVNEIISSSDSEASVDSDIMMVSSSEPSEVHAGPSRIRPASATASAPAPTPAPVPAPAYPHHYIPTPLLPMSSQPPPPPPTQNVIPIETISQSDSDDDSSEVMVVGYIKPPQDRTPEVVDLLGSDSDVVVQESPQPERSSEAEQSRLLVKLSMKMHRARENGNSDSDDSYRPPAPAKRRRTTRSADAATTTSDTCRTTPSPTLSTLAPQSPAPANRWDSSGASSSSSRDWSSSSSFSSNTTSSSSDSSSAEDDSSWSDSNTKKSKVSKRKTKKTSSKDSNANRSRKKSKKRVSHTRHKSKNDKSSKCKSYSGKGIKSSKKSNDSNDGILETLPYTSDEPQPGPSGTASNQKHKSRGKATKKGIETIGISTLIQNIQNDLEQLRQSGTSGHQKQKTTDKSSKKCKESVDVSTIIHNTQKYFEEPQPVDFCTTVKQKNTKNHTNEGQQPGPSGTSNNHKQKSVREKTTKKNKETVNVSTLIYGMQNHKEQEPINKGLISKEKSNGDPVLWRPICIKSNTNEDEQPGPSGVSSNHKHRSNREKSSKKHDAVQATASAQMAKDEDEQPGPSGSSSNHKAKSSREKSLKKYKESSPNLMQSNEDEPVSSYRHKSSRDRNRRLPSRENKRLKSVVNIMYSNSNKNAGEIDTQGSPGGHSNTSSNHTYSEGRARKRYESPPPPSSPATRPPSSDSEDDLPLNLTIQNLISHASLPNKEQMYK